MICKQLETTNLDSRFVRSRFLHFTFLRAPVGEYKTLYIVDLLIMTCSLVKFQVYMSYVEKGGYIFV